MLEHVHIVNFVLIDDVDIDTGNADEIPLKDSAQADN